VGIAAFELALGSRIRSRDVLVFATLHVLVLGWVVRFGGGLCVRDRNAGLDGEWRWTED
jgi:hypothetical protein